jgi:hypothetical protein
MRKWLIRFGVGIAGAIVLSHVIEREVNRYKIPPRKPKTPMDLVIEKIYTPMIREHLTPMPPMNWLDAKWEEMQNPFNLDDAH